MSLRQRALLAIVLTVGFYALALALMAAMIWVIFQPNVPGRALGFCIFGVVVIAISIIPWPRRFIPPGPLLNPAGQPRLFAELQTVALAVGAGAMMEGLRALARGSVAWAGYWRNEVVPLLEAGFQPPIAEGFQRFINEPQINQEVEKAAEQLLKEGRTDPYDSHPPDSERIAALASMPAGPPDGTGPPAATLVDGIDAIQPFLLIGMLNPGIQMRRITWQDAGSVALLPGLRDRVRRQAHMLRDYSVGWLPELLKYADRLGHSEAGAASRQVPAEQARSLGVGLAGAAFAVALADHGWTAESLPGRPVAMRRDGDSLKPFVEVNRLARGEVDMPAWQQRCTDLGIRDYSLTPA